MYVVKREKGKKLPKALAMKFASYDKARQAVRKWLITQIHAQKQPYYFVDVVDNLDYTNRTVSIGKHGFSIMKNQ